MTNKVNSPVNNIKDTFDKPQGINKLNSSLTPDKDSMHNYKEELKKLEIFYEQMLKNKDQEYEKILVQVDNELAEKESENDEIKNKNIEITNKYNILVDLLKDYESEKEDYQKTIIQLTNKLEENKKASEKFISQLKKLQAIKPNEENEFINNLGKNLYSNSDIISQALEKEINNQKIIPEGNTIDEIKNEVKSEVKNESIGFLDSNIFTNKFLEFMKDYEFYYEKYKNFLQEKNFKIKVLDLENLLYSVFDENKELKNKVIDIQNTLTTRDSKLKDLIEKDQKISNNIEELRKEKINLQNKINELNQISLLKENLSIEKLDKQESYYKIESQKKDEEINELKISIKKFIKKQSESDIILTDLNHEIEKKNDLLFEFKNKSLDKDQTQVYYSELCKNTDNFISEKQKVLEKNIVMFKEVEDNIVKIKSDIKDLKKQYDQAEVIKKNVYDYNNNSDSLISNNPLDNANINSIKNNLYLKEIEKVLDDIDDNFGKIEDNIFSNFAMKNNSNLLNKISSDKVNTNLRNNSVLINNKKNSIICRAENLNSTMATNNSSNNNDNKVNKTNISSDSNSNTEENISNMDDTSNFVGKSKILIENENLNTNNNSITNTRSNIDFENYNIIFNNFIEKIEKINTEYLEIINGLVQSEKFLMSIINNYKKIIFQQNHDLLSIKLEIELSLKNENFLKNSIIYMQQVSLENFGSILPKAEIEDILFDINNLSNAICQMDAPDLIKFCSNVSNEINLKINNFVNEKNLLLENQNEKLNYLKKELELLKKVEVVKQDSENKKEKQDKQINLQLHKLQAQLKLREEENARLNERIEDQFKTINKLSKENTNNMNNSNNNTNSVKINELILQDKKNSTGNIIININLL